MGAMGTGWSGVKQNGMIYNEVRRQRIYGLCVGLLKNGPLTITRITD